MLSVNLFVCYSKYTHMQGCNKKIIHCNMLKTAYEQEYCTEAFSFHLKGAMLSPCLDQGQKRNLGFLKSDWSPSEEQAWFYFEYPRLFYDYFIPSLSPFSCLDLEFKPNGRMKVPSIPNFVLLECILIVSYIHEWFLPYRNLNNHYFPAICESGGKNTQC